MVDAVVRSVVDQDTIRANMPQVIPALVLELSQCAQQYTGCVRTDELVFDECVEFVTTRFGWLNIMEIRSAFRLAAAGELGEVKLEAYFGTFTVAMLGKVLNAYKEYRERLAKEIREAEKAAEVEEAQVLKSETWDSEAWKERRLNTLLNMENLSVDCCTVYDFQCFVEPHVSEIPEGDKRLLWDDAWRLEVGHFQDMAFRGSVSARRVLQNPANDEGFKLGRLNWYKRLLVKRWIESLKQSST